MLAQQAVEEELKAEKENKKKSKTVDSNSIEKVQEAIKNTKRKTVIKTKLEKKKEKLRQRREKNVKNIGETEQKATTLEAGEIQQSTSGAFAVQDMDTPNSKEKKESSRSSCVRLHIHSQNQFSYV